MPVARLHLDDLQPAAAALARGQALFEGVSAERPVLFYGAELDAAAVVLGAYQHAPAALNTDGLASLALPVLRRPTGGAAVWAGQGLLYCALGLQSASTLMACPRGRILNRNVRGMLAGIRTLSVPAHYFGRDFISFNAEPGAYVGWDESGTGRVLLEFFVALDTPFVLPEGLSGYPQPQAAPLRGKAPTTLRAAGARTQSGREVLQAIADGYARSFSLELRAEPPRPEELARAQQLRAGLTVDPVADDGLRWSSPHEDAIGFVIAGMRLATDGTIAGARVGGDFYQPRDNPERLERSLLGRTPDPQTLGLALDTLYASDPGMIEGLRSLNTLRNALLDAAQLVRGG